MTEDDRRVQRVENRIDALIHSLSQLWQIADHLAPDDAIRIKQICKSNLTTLSSLKRK